jgi:cytochrome c5
MKYTHLLSIAVISTLFSGCGSTTDDVPIVSTDIIGLEDTIDEIADTYTLSSHNQGLTCLTCHSSGSYAAPLYSDALEDDENELDDEYEYEDDNDEVFDSGATIFTTLNAADGDLSKAANGYSLRLVLENSAGVAEYRIGNGTGNVNGTFNAGITNYTVEVLDSNGNVVNTSVTNSHNTSRFDCNSCHTAAGNNGAPGRIVSYAFVDTSSVTDTTTTEDVNTSTVDTTTAALSFVNDVDPILETNCASCHGSSGSFSITNSSTPYAGVTPFVDTANATNSDLLLKATNQSSHGGGAIFSSTSTEYTTIRDWISQGALDN